MGSKGCGGSIIAETGRGCGCGSNSRDPVPEISGTGTTQEIECLFFLTESDHVIKPFEVLDPLGPGEDRAFSQASWRGGFRDIDIRFFW